jgi:hypothetical protein
MFGGCCYSTGGCLTSSGDGTKAGEVGVGGCMSQFCGSYCELVTSLVLFSVQAVVGSKEWMLEVKGVDVGGKRS